MSETPRPKRRLKPPQTVRDLTRLSADTPKDKPKRLSKTRSALKAPFIKTSSFLSKYRFFRLLAKVIRFIGRIIVPGFIRRSFKELKLVTWPSWKESRKLSYAVLAFAIVFGALVATLDYGFGKLFKAILLGNHH